MSNPLYEPRTTDLNPEALAAFRASQRLMLPVNAQRNYERAKAALAAGDADRALALANEAWRSSTAAWRTRRRNCANSSMTLIEQANEAIAARERDRLHRSRPRRHPSAPAQPPDAPDRSDRRSPPSRRLAGNDHRPRRQRRASSSCNTPLNRHHERMIVSPAKAWRSGPRQGAVEPVSYRISVKVNLPESGTDF